MKIRKAELRDLPALLEIYNFEVKNGMATFDVNERTLEEREKWFYAHNRDNHPLIVAEIDGRAVAYASLSTYREKEAYRSTVELSVYVAPGFRCQGIAEALMRELIDLARADGVTHTIVSVITSTNTASLRLHEKLGFEHCGVINEVGVKFGKFMSICNMQLIL